MTQIAAEFLALIILAAILAALAVATLHYIFRRLR